VGLEDGLLHLAGAGLLASGLWLARIPLKGLCDVWVEKTRGKENCRLEQERRRTELELERERRETQLAVIRAQALAALPPVETRVSAGHELPRPP
jgi:hypothetical protein